MPGISMSEGDGDSTRVVSSHKDDATPQYKPFHQIRESQPIRATCFHPTGDVYAVGSNSKQLRICFYPTAEELQDFTGDDSILLEPAVACRFLQIHRASIYCVKFNKKGNLLATGSNDQTVHVIKYDSAKQEPADCEYKLTMHNGTVRDLCFLNDTEEQDIELLVTAGAGDYEIFITDCENMKQTMSLRGHDASIMSLHHHPDKATSFFSASLDGTIRSWDTRSKACTSIISTNRPGGDAINDKQGGTPVGSIRVDDSGKLLVAGHSDGRCMLYDIRGGKIIQLFKAHEDEIRTVNLSPRNRYLLTGSYDHTIKMIDLQGDLTRKLPSVDIATLEDKVIQTAWHPNDYNFVTTSADGSATLWTMPGLAKRFDEVRDLSLGYL